MITATLYFIVKILLAVFFGFWKLMAAFGFVLILGIGACFVGLLILRAIMNAWSDVIFPFDD